MENTETSAGLTLVTTEDDKWPAVADLPERSRAIVERLMSFAGPKPPQRAASEFLNIDRETWRKLRIGEAVSDGSYQKAERALSDREYADGVDRASTSDVDPADFVQFELTVDAIGLHIIGKGTTANAAEVRKQVADLYREIRDKGE